MIAGGFPAVCHDGITVFVMETKKNEQTALSMVVHQ